MLQIQFNIYGWKVEIAKWNVQVRGEPLPYKSHFCFIFFWYDCMFGVHDVVRLSKENCNLWSATKDVAQSGVKQKSVMPHIKTEFTRLWYRRKKIKLAFNIRRWANIVCRMYCIVCRDYTLSSLYSKLWVGIQGLVHCVESLNSLIRDWVVLPISVDSPR